MSRIVEVLRRGRDRLPPDAVYSVSEDGARVPAAGVLESYRVPQGGGPLSSAQIFVVEDEGTGRYLVRLPPLTRGEAEALRALRGSLYRSIPVDAKGSPKAILSDFLGKSAEEEFIGQVVEDSREKLLYYLEKDFSGFWEVDPLFNDDAIEEISVTRWDGPVRVLHRRYSEFAFMETDLGYESEERLQAFIRRLAQLGGTSVSLAQPSLEVTLHGPSDRRVTATLGDEISRPGSTYAVRKQKEHPITLTKLAATEPPGRQGRTSARPRPRALAYDEDHAHKTLSVLMAAYFWLLLERTTNVLIAGETNSGKTTLMNALLALTTPRGKVVTAEDVLEISLPGHLHWQRLKTRSRRAGASQGSRYEYTLSDLLKLALRFSPTVLSLGEMRGEESETLAAAITLGFSTMTTIHAENAERCVQRLTTPPMRFLRGHVRDITAIATMRKAPLLDGRMARRVVSVDEIKPVGEDSHAIVNVFRYDNRTDSFFPTTAAEVVDRSYRLTEIASALGWSPGRVQESLSERAAHLAGRVASMRFAPEDLSAMVSEFSLLEASKEAA